ncbi:MAG: hypothetical protein HETSPECPRED_003435 [Heterodermia speciosa]|uniref:Rhodopsin domain-containing protein n=1 Tax=Heterodermia speciosa TaxID=116794 RepID=A0A8H3EEL9_9LECA|nr:MAG: hypothetical protein HETSPECPRED_003435 [Heterodermia speciosa]
MDPIGSYPHEGNGDQGQVLLIALVVTSVFAVSLVGAKIWARTKIAEHLGWDDLFVVLGVGFAIAAIAPFVKALHAGLGRLAQSLRPEQVVQVGCWSYIAQYIVAISTAFVRLSVACLLMRNFGTTKYWRWGLLLAIIFIVTTKISILILLALECRPLQKTWDPMLNGSCWSWSSRSAFITYQRATGIISDWGLALLPVAGLWNTQLKLRRKVVIWTLMGMGLFTGVCPLVRLLQIKKYAVPELPHWVLLDQALWAVLEMNLGIVASCVSSLTPLL